MGNFCYRGPHKNYYVSLIRSRDVLADTKGLWIWDEQAPVYNYSKNLLPTIFLNNQVLIKQICSIVHTSSLCDAAGTDLYSVGPCIVTLENLPKNLRQRIDSVNSVVKKDLKKLILCETEVELTENIAEIKKKLLKIVNLLIGYLDEI